MKDKLYKIKNTSISKRLIKSFVLLLSCMVIINAVSVVMNLRVINQYKSIISNIALEGQVKVKTAELVNMYNSVI